MNRIRQYLGICSALAFVACNNPSDFRNASYDHVCEKERLPPKAYLFNSGECRDVTPNTCAAVIAKLRERSCAEAKPGVDRVFCCAD
ncbi:MAG TPA: hypothetical protein PK156_30650 [Polyangium sp.]|nr:hypothetical protein [Polyangium sp.]